MSDLLTTSEAADLLRVSTRTVQRWANLGRIQAVRLPGGRVRIPRTALNDLLSDDGGEAA